jgi:hypothetical protein
MIQFGEIDLPMNASAKIRPLFAALLLATSLGACTSPGGNADDGAARFFVTSDQFVLFNCEQLATKAAAVAAREKELQALMVQAGPSSDGRLVSALAYRPEYLTLRGNMSDLRKTATEKNCKPMLALENPSGRASDSVVR